MKKKIVGFSSYSKKFGSFSRKQEKRKKTGTSSREKQKAVKYNKCLRLWLREGETSGDSMKARQKEKGIGSHREWI